MARNTGSRYDGGAAGLKPLRRLGQHFLVDENVADWMVGQASIEPGDRVLEIGPGPGILTRRLARLTSNLVAIEKDGRFIPKLEEEPGVEVIHGDALEVELPEFDKVVSNLPYNISSPLTLRLVQRPFELGLLMYQREFAEHLVARPGQRSYSRLSVMVGYRMETEILRTVPKGCFRPVPKVDSAIVRLTPRSSRVPMASEEAFGLVVSVLFSHKNRKVRNGFAAEHRRLGLEKDEARDMASDLPHVNERPVNLRIEDLADISDHFFRLKGGLSPPRNTSG